VFRPRAFVPLAFALLLLIDPGAVHARSRHANERTGKLVPAFAELVKARKRGDRGALGRLGDRIGPARLAQAIAGNDERTAEAALAAVPLTRGGIVLVGAIADQLGASDQVRAVAASAALGALLDGAVPTALEDWDVPPDLVARACGGLHALAARKGATTAARLAALDAVLEAAPSCGAYGDLAALARDPAAEIRRAAVLVAAAGPERTAVLSSAIADADRGVSAAATAAECRVEARAARGGKERPPAAPAVATARTLAAAPSTAPADAVEMVDCLAAAGTPADRTLLDELRRGPPSPVRDRAVELGALAKGHE
jgi:hypothetical protein